jgi:hypothetical protein
MSARDTTHEYVCVDCGVRLQGREVRGGEIRPTNAPPDGQVFLCRCALCSGEITPDFEGPAGVAALASGRYA